MTTPTAHLTITVPGTYAFLSMTASAVTEMVTETATITVPGGYHAERQAYADLVRIYMEIILNLTKIVVMIGATIALYRYPDAIASFVLELLHGPQGGGEAQVVVSEDETDHSD